MKIFLNYSRFFLQFKYVNDLLDTLLEGDYNRFYYEEVYHFPKFIVFLKKVKFTISAI